MSQELVEKLAECLSEGILDGWGLDVCLVDATSILIFLEREGYMIVKKNELDKLGYGREPE